MKNTRSESSNKMPDVLPKRARELMLAAQRATEGGWVEGALQAMVGSIQESARVRGWSNSRLYSVVISVLANLRRGDIDKVIEGLRQLAGWLRKNGKTNDPGSILCRWLAAGFTAKAGDDAAAAAEMGELLPVLAHQQSDAPTNVAGWRRQYAEVLRRLGRVREAREHEALAEALENAQ